MVDDAVAWAEFEHSDSELAGLVKARFDSHLHAVIATLRCDGSPRLSGMEAPIRSGQLWLGMTPGSRKAVDLHRDPRFALHSAPDTEQLPKGDARIEGVAELADPEQQAQFIAGHRFPVDDPSMMVLYVGRIRRVVLVRVTEPYLLIESWTPTGGRSTSRQQ